MDPNQQPGQTPTPQPPTQPPVPQTPTSYTSPVETSYDPNYLDSIAAPPPQAKFLSGTFGKLFWVLIGVFVLAVSLIIAFSGGDDTADLQQISVRLDNFAKTTKTANTHFKSQNLKNINSDLMIWITGNQGEAESLLNSGGVKKTDYSKEMVRKEAAIAEALDTKFEDSRLAGRLNRVYTSTMAAETEKIINLLNTMSKKSKSKPIREFAKKASTNLVPIQKKLNDYIDDGN